MARQPDPAARPLLEILLGFVGALLVVPILLRTVSGLFRSSFVRRLFTEALVVGATTLLTKEGALDKLFGAKGETTALLKSDAEG